MGKGRAGEAAVEEQSLGKEMVEKAMEQLQSLQAASERAISQLEGQAVATFDAADEQTTRDFMKATDIKGFESVVNSFKGNVLSTITVERSKKAVVRGRMFEKVGSVFNVVHQGMQQELASLLALEQQRAEHRYKQAEDLLKKSRAAKEIEIDNAVKRALMEKEDAGSEIDSVTAFYGLQLEIMVLTAAADKKMYPRSAIRKWKEQTEDISDDVDEAKEQVQMRHTELNAMVSNLVAQSADLEKLGKLYADMEHMRIQNGQLSKRIVEMQDEQDDLKADMADMAAEHNSQLGKLNEQWGEKMQGMSKNKHEATIEALKQRMADVENHVQGFDETLVQLEKGMYDPSPEASDKAEFTSVLDKRRKATKRAPLADDAVGMALEAIEGKLPQSLRDLVDVKTDADNKMVALKAVLDKRAANLAAQMDKLSDNPSGCAHIDTQYSMTDLPEYMRPKDAEVQVGEKPPKMKAADAQTEISGEINTGPAIVQSANASEMVEAEAQTEGYFVMEALAVRQAQREADPTRIHSGLDDRMPLVDPDALLKIEELMATLQEKEEEIVGLKNARETLTKMLANLRANQSGAPLPEPEPEPVVAYSGLDAEMVAALRAELQRAYSLIQTLEAASPGSTPAIFKSLLGEHDFCLFCGSKTHAGDKDVGNRKVGNWRTDEEAELVLNGGAGFVKFWYGKGTPGYGGRSGGMPRERSTTPSGHRAPGAGPGGWGGAGGNESSGLTTGGGSGGADVSQRDRRRPQTADGLVPGPGARGSRSLEDVSSVQRPRSTDPGAQRTASGPAGRPHTAGSVISMGTTATGGGGLGNATFGLGTSASAGDVSDMLRRSTVPSAQAMSRRLKQANWSSGGQSNVPSFRPGSAMLDPHPHAVAAEARDRNARLEGRPATAEGTLPPAGPRPGAGRKDRSRSARAVAGASGGGGGRVRGRPPPPEDSHHEDKTGHMQRFLDSMVGVPPPEGELPAAVP